MLPEDFFEDIFCANCKEECPTLFMLKNDVWYSIQGIDHKQVYCLKCTQNALGRELTVKDFPLDVPLNDLFWWGFKLGKKRWQGSPTAGDSSLRGCTV